MTNPETPPRPEVDPKEVRSASDHFEQADRELKDARNAFDGAALAYDFSRRYNPGSAETVRARSAWAIAGREWIAALTVRETAKDALAAARGERLDDAPASVPTENVVRLPSRRPAWRDQ